MALSSRSLLCLPALLLSSFALSGEAHARTWVVAKLGTRDFSTIQAAINAASAGDLIQVKKGTYAEAIDFKGKAVSVYSAEGAATTIIKGPSTKTNVVTFQTGEGSGSLLRGFTIQTSGTNKRGAYIKNSSPTIENCFFSALGGTSISGGGAYVTAGAPTFDTVFFTGNTGNLGGHIYATNKSVVTIRDSLLKSGTAPRGSAIWAYDSRFVISDTVIRDSVADNQGGIYADYTTLELDNVDFLANSGSGSEGSAIYAFNNSSIYWSTGQVDGNSVAWCKLGAVALIGGYAEISGVSFTLNEGGYGAGMALTDGAWLTGSSLSFDSNLGDDDGGALWLSEGAGMEGTGFSFTQNVALDGGGALYLDRAGYVGLSDSSFQLNNTEGSGGAVGMEDSGWVSLSAVVFDENTAAEDGGAIWAADMGDGIMLSEVEVTDNVATAGSGGGLYYDASSYLTVYDSLFARNTAQLDGGGLYYRTENPGTAIQNTNFVDNVATTGSGGGAFLGGLDWNEVTDSDFTGNQAAVDGGGLLVAGTVNVVGSNFSTNHSEERGGAIAFVPTYGGVDAFGAYDSTFDSNTAGSEGGAIALIHISYGNISSSSFTNNSVPSEVSGSRGGAIYTYQLCGINVSWSVFGMNSANLGGAVYEANNYATSYWYRNIFQQNEASSSGGALYLSAGAWVAFIHNDVLGNEAPMGGGLFMVSTAAHVVSSILAWNPGGAVYAGDTHATNNNWFSYNLWYQNDDGDLGGLYSASQRDGTGTITNSAPELRAVSLNGYVQDDDWTPMEISPVIDAGDPSYTDEDGSRGDIGARWFIPCGDLDFDCDGTPDIETVRPPLARRG